MTREGRKSIKRRSRSMSVPMSSQTVATAHRHCSSKGIDMSEWVERTVRKAIAKADAGIPGQSTKKPGKSGGKKVKVVMPDPTTRQLEDATRVL